MVTIASSAGNTEAWESGLHGLLSGFCFWYAVYVIKWLKIDDPGNVAATFLLPGIIGGVLPGFIDADLGVYWSGYKSGQMLGTNVVGTLGITLWSIFWGVVIFVILYVFGVLKLDENESLEGSVITQRGFTKVVANKTS